MDPRPLVLRAHYFGNTPSLGHYPTHNKPCAWVFCFSKCPPFIKGKKILACHAPSNYTRKIKSGLWVFHLPWIDIACATTMCRVRTKDGVRPFSECGHGPKHGTWILRITHCEVLTYLKRSVPNFFECLWFCLRRRGGTLWCIRCHP